MRTDGLNAFDADTQAALPHLEDFEQRVQRGARQDFRLKLKDVWGSLAERNLWVRQEYKLGERSAAEIGVAVGLSVRSVRAIAGPTRQGHRPRNPKASAAAREFARRTAAGEVVRAKDIAARHGVSKNALLGARYRMR